MLIKLSISQHQYSALCQSYFSWPTFHLVSTMWFVHVCIFYFLLGVSFFFLSSSTVHKKTSEQCVCLKVCVCVHITIDSHAISWWIFIKSRLCDMGNISPSLVLFSLILSFLPPFLLPLSSSPFYLLTWKYYYSWQTSENRVCVRACVRVCVWERDRDHIRVDILHHYVNRKMLVLMLSYKISTHWTEHIKLWIFHILIAAVSTAQPSIV